MNWRCPTCQRTFKNKNQWHSCTDKSIDDILLGISENLLLAFDALLVAVSDWQPGTVGAAKKAIVFTKHKAWMIVRPMTEVLDVKFYYKEKIHHHRIKKTSSYRDQVAHHIRLSNPEEVDQDFIELLRKGYEYS